MNKPLEKWQVNGGKRIIKLLRKHCHPGRELQLLVNLINYHFIHTDAELDKATWHPPYHIKNSVEHDGWKCVQFLMQCPHFVPGQIYQKLKIICKNQNAMRMAYSRLGDSPRWCRNYEGLDHRWSPSWGTGREFCTKCGMPRYPDLPFVKFGEPAVELLPPAIKDSPNIVVEPKHQSALAKSTLDGALNLLAKVDASRPRTFGILNDPKVNWDMASAEPDTTIPAFTRNKQYDWDRLKAILAETGEIRIRSNPESLELTRVMFGWYNWVPVEKGLPPFRELVLVAFDTHAGKQYTTAKLVHQKMCAAPESDNYADIWYVEVSSGHELRTVTHWQRIRRVDGDKPESVLSQKPYAELQKERDGLQAEVKRLQAVIDRLEDEKPRSNY